MAKRKGQRHPPKLRVLVISQNPLKFAVTGARPLTSNQSTGRNRYVVAKQVALWRKAVADTSFLSSSFPLRPAHIVAQPVYFNMRSRPDTGAAHPTVKAIVDGLVDAGAWPDDNPDYVSRITHLPPVMCHNSGDGIIIEVVEVREKD